MPLLRDVLSWVADLAYPSTCAHCKTFCDDSGPLCDDCDAKLRELAMAAACPNCATPVAQANAPCPRCLGKGLYPYARVTRLGKFDEPIKTLIHQVKYHRRWSLGEWLADRLLEQPRTKKLLEHIDAIIPVPLHPKAHRARGYNQAEVIAGRLSSKTGLALLQPVARIRNTESQTNLTQKARHANVRGA